ncbi:hypothetical protein [Variovorax sp. DXTD-1]|uniref:hypothetical protein n=1 Tax=Variovorax sp. DXTD-1 TaxID=2495592 RepID=UPI0021AEA256|nr:hypothetical protein [Variovorax sp. DXTD-1]
MDARDPIDRCKGVGRLGACLRQAPQAAQQAREIGCGSSRGGLDLCKKNEFVAVARAAAHHRGVPFFLGLACLARKSGRVPKALHDAIVRNTFFTLIQRIRNLAERLHAGFLGILAPAGRRAPLGEGGMAAGHRPLAFAKRLVAPHGIHVQQAAAAHQPLQSRVGKNGSQRGMQVLLCREISG